MNFTVQSNENCGTMASFKVMTKASGLFLSPINEFFKECDEIDGLFLESNEIDVLIATAIKIANFS